MFMIVIDEGVDGTHPGFLPRGFTLQLLGGGRGEEGGGGGGEEGEGVGEGGGDGGRGGRGEGVI
jgi:hypothetical protein